jgi:hypothetical protein
MPRITTNFAEIPDQKSFDPIPAGNYTLKFVDYEETETQSGNNEGATLYKLKFEVESDDEAVNGRGIYDQIVWLDGIEEDEKGAKGWYEFTLPKVKAMLLSFGADPEKSTDAQGNLDFEFDDLIGETCYAKIGVQPANKDKKTGREYSAKNVVRKFLIEEDEG